MEEKPKKKDEDNLFDACIDLSDALYSIRKECKKYDDYALTRRAIVQARKILMHECYGEVLDEELDETTKKIIELIQVKK